MSLNSIVPLHLRRSFLKNAAPGATRSYFTFMYPHSFTGTNNAFNKTPQKNVYPDIQRTFQPGEQAPFAH